MKQNALKHIILVLITVAFLVITLGFISTEKKTDNKKAVFLKKIIARKSYE